MLDDPEDRAVARTVMVEAMLGGTETVQVISRQARGRDTGRAQADAQQGAGGGRATERGKH